MLPESIFGKGRNGSRRSACATCRGKQRSPGKLEEMISRAGERRKEWRVSDPARAILYDSRQTDKKFGRSNDLEKDFICEMIRYPCSYCGETELRMTLDRIDNSLGHVKSNVVPACIRCNYARGNMPYEAWMYLTSGMRSARLAGAFGNWIG